MTGRRLVAAAILFAVFVGFAVGLGVAFLRDDDDNGSAAPPPPTGQTTTSLKRPDPITSPEAAELFDLVNSFTELTLHAKYRVAVVAQPDRTSLLEIWQQDGKSRQEAVIEDPTGPRGRVAILNLEDRVVLCQQPPNGSYTCGRGGNGNGITYEITGPFR